MFDGVTPLVTIKTHSSMGKKNLDGARHDPCAPSGELVARSFLVGSKIDKNVQINAGRGSGTTGCHLAFLYKFLLGLKDVPSPYAR